ncbi:hypothetical protein McanCB21832_000159 [Microsporum canis]
MSIPDIERLALVSYIHWIFLIVAKSMVKLAIGFQFLRIAQPKGCSLLVKGLMVTTISRLGPFVFRCRPIKVYWTYSMSDETCIGSKAMSIISVVMCGQDVMTDLILTNLPLYYFPPRRLVRRAGVVLSGIVGLGYLYDVAAMTHSILSVYLDSGYRGDIFFLLSTASHRHDSMLHTHPTPLVRELQRRNPSQSIWTRWPKPRLRHLFHQSRRRLKNTNDFGIQICIEPADIRRRPAQSYR